MPYFFPTLVSRVQFQKLIWQEESQILSPNPDPSTFPPQNRLFSILESCKGTEIARTLSPNQDRGKSDNEVEPGGEEGRPKTKRPIVHGGEGGP